MLERIAPHLAMIGIHKNGTWAAQKIIECVQTPDEVALVTQNLRPYVPPLLLDQFGNYVVQLVSARFQSFQFADMNIIDAAFVSVRPPRTSCSRRWSIVFGRLLRVGSARAV
jgi:hypothetical protein